MVFRAWCVDQMNGPDAVGIAGGGDLLPGIPFSAGFNATVVQKTLDLHAFCREPRIQLEGAKISTVEIVQYLANARGGAHFDPAGSAARKPKGMLLAKLEAGDTHAPKMIVGDRSLLHHEILSIAQAMLASTQVQQLRLWRPPSRQAGR
jgi:hypothetical protein